MVKKKQPLSRRFSPRIAQKLAKKSAANCDHHHDDYDHNDDHHACFSMESPTPYHPLFACTKSPRLDAQVLHLEKAKGNVDNTYERTRMTKRTKESANFDNLEVCGHTNGSTVDGENIAVANSTFELVKAIIPMNATEDPKKDTYDHEESGENDNNISWGAGEPVPNCINKDDPKERSTSLFPHNFREHISTSLNLTEMAEHWDDDLNEVDSLLCNTGLASVNEYRVNPKHADLLMCILSQHGDIAANCSLKSAAFRSSCMELLCETIMTLKKSTLLGLKENDLENMMACVDDVEKQGVEVGWLKKRLNEISEAKQAIRLLGKSSGLRQNKAELKAKIEGLKQKKEVYEGEISIILAQVRELQEKFEGVENDLSVAEAEAGKLDDMIQASKAKVRQVVDLETLVSGLLPEDCN